MHIAQEGGPLTRLCPRVASPWVSSTFAGLEIVGPLLAALGPRRMVPTALVPLSFGGSLRIPFRDSLRLTLSLAVIGAFVLRVPQHTANVAISLDSCLPALLFLAFFLAFAFAFPPEGVLYQF